MPFSLTWLADVLVQAGLNVAEVPGWKNRGRAEVGPIKGVICHHTAGAANGNMPSLSVITNGRTGLPGPLAQLGLGRDGTYYVVAAGRCNHAGAGNWQGLRNGNQNFIGIEAENTGLGEAWPAVQLDAYRRGAAAILKRVRADAIMCCSHKEYALPPGRKPDPKGIDMVDFRLHVSMIMAGIAPGPSVIPADDGTGRPTLSRGASGDAVLKLQLLLKIAQTGTFDGATEAAVRVFQRTNELVPDGIVGPKTWSVLAAVA